MGMSMTRGAMVFMAFWRAAICFLMLSSSWCSLFWEQPVSAYLLARLGGKDKPSKEDVSAILDSVGIKADDAKLNALFEDVEKLASVDEAIAQGMAKLAVIPSGGGGGGGGGSGPAAAADAGAGAAAEPEEEEEESKSSEAGGNLFGGDDSSSEDESS